MANVVKNLRWKLLLPLLFGGLLYSLVTQAASGSEELVAHEGFATTFLWIAVILLVAKFASLVERVGQPAVLGELIAGMVLGNLILLGFPFFEPVKENSIILFLAELGVVILLFQIGLESNITEMRKVGTSAFLVALIGVAVPFLLGTYLVGPWLLPELSFNAHLFLGAALTATSVGITARVFQDLGKLQTREAKTILGAAVLDDILGLIILAVVSGLVTAGAISAAGVGMIIAKALLFLGGAVVAGHFFAPWLGRAFSTINTGVGMKFTLAVSFGLVFAFLADRIGLAPIVGAFAAGLVLDAVHFRFFRYPAMIDEVSEAVEHATWGVKQKVKTILERHADKHVEELIEPLAYLFVPLFFVVTAMSVDLSTLASPGVVLTALAITAVAVAGKVVAGLAAGSANKWIVGFGMVPRGEVGLIFAAIGKGLGVISPSVFSIIVIMVILTTLLTPPVLAFLLKRASV